MDTSGSYSPADLDRASQMARTMRGAQGRHWMRVVPFARSTRDLTQGEQQNNIRLTSTTGEAGRATDLEAAVRDGRFRQDLFHRLGQFQLRVPPLRERPEDIVALAEHFLRLKAPNKNFSSQAISALLSHGWLGNIRELRNLVAKMAMESSGSEIDFSRLSAALTGEPTVLRQTASMPVSNLDSMEEQMIIKALERTGGDPEILKVRNFLDRPGISSSQLGGDL